MVEKILLSFIFVLILAELSLGDKEANSAGTYVKALGKSGKIKIGFQENIDTDPNRVVVEMDELKERDSSGNEVGKTGSTKHSFNTFASQDFTFTNVVESTFQDIKVNNFTFKSQLLSGIADLTVIVYIFKEAGNITLGDEESEVEEGNVKFSILLQKWKFCGSSSGDDNTCKKGNTNEFGAFLDFVSTIKGKGTPTPKNKNNGGKKQGQMYDLGGSELILSNKVQYDGGSFKDMASGYPKIVTQGSKTSFIFRFQKFKNSAFYDPTIKGSENGVARSLLSPILSLLVFVVTVYLKF